MKTNCLLTYLLFVLPAAFPAQTASPSGETTTKAIDSAPASSDTYAVLERGAHHTIWQRLTVDAQGVTNTHSYTELATGLNFWNPAISRWEETKELFQISDKGYAVATNGQHKLIVAPDIAAPGGAIDFLGPDSQRLLSSPIGLAFRDTGSGKTVLIAGVTNCVGEMAQPNVILYPKSFDTLKAAISYTYRRGGIEQDVILYQKLPSPADYGFDPETTACEMWTEFFSAPHPAVSEVDASGDQALAFGQTQMGRGVAYLLSDSELQPVPLQKTWAVIDERKFLVESVPYGTLKPLLAKLQAGVEAPTKGRVTSASFSDRTGFVARALQHKPNAAPATQLASIRPGQQRRATGLCLDYQTLNTSQTNYTFASDTTYYISSSVDLAGTNTVIEGGTVIKFTNNTSAKLNFTQGGLGCKTGPYRMAILTSKDDNSVGEAISGSTGSPTNYPGATYLSSPAATLQYLRFCYAGTAVDGGHEAHSALHCQFIGCTTGISQDESDIVLRNVLFAQCGTCAKTHDNVFGEHLTVDACSTFAWEHVNDGWITNSIFTGVSTVGPVTLYYSLQQSSSGGIYQAAGAGSYYLCDGSTNRNAGTTNIDPNLISDLRQKTTYPPILYSNITITTNTTLSPQAQRDTDAPDIGYHYDPVDHIASLLNFTNCSLTVAPGTVIACYNSAGIWLQDGSSIYSVGTPLLPIWYTRYQAVQEQPVPLGQSTPPSGVCVATFHYGSVGPTAVYRFCRFSCPANGGYHFDHYSSWSHTSLLVQDCELWGGNNIFTGNPNTLATLKDNLFARCFEVYAYTLWTNTLAVSNNLCWAVPNVSMRSGNTAPWTVYNNLFDSCWIGSTGPLPGSGFNAYWNCNKQLNPTNASDITLTNAIAYQSGPLGDFYQATNSVLINNGSCSADLASLYHYTTTTNQAKEAASIVDIGFHYVATDANGMPIDTDGDGLADFLADKNGNGLTDFGEFPFGITIENPANGSIINK